MYAQMVTPIMHIILSFVCLDYFQMGVVGLGVSASITGLTVFLLQNYMMKRNLPHAQTILKVKWNDPRNIS